MTPKIRCILLRRESSHRLTWCGRTMAPAEHGYASVDHVISLIGLRKNLRPCRPCVVAVSAQLMQLAGEQA